jgi:hypothetical protein
MTMRTDTTKTPTIVGTLLTFSGHGSLNQMNATLLHTSGNPERNFGALYRRLCVQVEPTLFDVPGGDMSGAIPHEHSFGEDQP